MTIVCPEIKWIDKRGNPKEGFYLDKFVIEAAQSTVDRVCKREQDILFIFTGSEGSGKSNASVCFAYYMASLSGRKFNEDNVFFDIDKMMKFAGSTKEQIIIWDEAALGGLASDWTAESQKKLVSMLMVCRKLRHIFIFNVPRFYKLSPNIIERAYCMFYIFEDDHEEPGNFIIIGREGLENLYQEWRTTRKAFYFKYTSLPNPGHFDWYMPYLIDYVKYDLEKDAAILKCVNETKEMKMKKKLMEREQEIVFNLSKFGINQEDIAKIMNCSIKTIGNRFKQVKRGETYYNPLNLDILEPNLPKIEELSEKIDKDT
jgi:hypothetical protein